MTLDEIWTHARAVLEKPLLTINKYDVTLFSILFVVLVILVARMVNYSAMQLIRRRFKDAPDHLQGKVFALQRFIKYLIYVVAALIGLRSVGIDVTLLIASSTALLVGVGIGLQQSFNDVACGVILLFEGNLQVEDVVEMDSGLVGRVTYIGLRTSKIRTREGYTIIVPNSKLVVNNVINWSHNARHARFQVDVGVAYGSDVPLVKRILLEAAVAHAEVLADPPPFVWLNKFGENGLLFSLYFWTEETFAVEQTCSDLRFAIEAAFRQNGVVIPFPQRDLHVRTVMRPIPLEQKGEGV